MEWRDLPLVMTSEEAADILRVSERTIYRMIDDGRLEATRPGKAYVIPREAVMKAAGIESTCRQLLRELWESRWSSDEQGNYRIAVDPELGRRIRDVLGGE